MRAVNNVSFDIKRNTVHCLVGENGAGKSTLIKILTGALLRSGGTHPPERRRVQSPHSPKEAKQKGISTLFQELNVVDQLTVEENLTLGMEETTLGFLRKTDKINAMVGVMNSLEPSITPAAARLQPERGQEADRGNRESGGHRESDIIIMDEPTAAISEGEIARLFKIVKALREKNVTVIYISHRLDEIFELGDYVTVMRDGRHIDTRPVARDQGPLGADPDDDRQDRLRAVHAQGRRMQGHDPPGEEPLQPQAHDISFDVHEGEIVGFYGLVGAGKTELARAIYGVDDYEGEILFKGKKLPPSPDKAIEAGLPWCRRRDDPRGCSPSSPSAATCRS